MEGPDYNIGMYIHNITILLSNPISLSLFISYVQYD